MKQFDFYEFAGILVPGAVILFGLSKIYPTIELPVGKEEMSIGELGMFSILAYGAGHLIQALGNGIERIWWYLWKGMPTDWARTGDHPLLSKGQVRRLPEKIRQLLGMSCPDNLKEITQGDWYSITRQIYAMVAKAKGSQRLDAFNRTYGALRGLTACLLVILVALLFKAGLEPYKVEILLLVLCGVSLVRMHLFGKDYAQELFVQFLAVEPRDLQARKQETKE